VSESHGILNPNHVHSIEFLTRNLAESVSDTGAVDNGVERADSGWFRKRRLIRDIDRKSHGGAVVASTSTH
jgi:hypothetical protein